MSIARTEIRNSPIEPITNGKLLEAIGKVDIPFSTFKYHSKVEGVEKTRRQFLSFLKYAGAQPESRNRILEVVKHHTSLQSV